MTLILDALEHNGLKGPELALERRSDRLGERQLVDVEQTLWKNFGSVCPRAADFLVQTVLFHVDAWS